VIICRQIRLFSRASSSSAILGLIRLSEFDDDNDDD
jgi:hypothetical protein